MSLVVFPFKSEASQVVASNLHGAASHPRVSEVWAVAARAGAAMDSVEEAAGVVSSSTGTPVRVFSQERVGRLRPGKGDGMNTALRLAAERGFDRVHFYDADITNFDHGWIDGAEAGADRGFEVVRHTFPRAATDAMVTWMVTRPALAMLFPGTMLPRIGQPLGGELLLGAASVASLASDPSVSERSDWGIDTMITYATAGLGEPILEHLIASGKRHALYGSLEEIRPMVLECLDAVASLKGRPAPRSRLVVEGSAPVPDDLKRVVGYDRERSVALLTADWSDDEVALAGTLPISVEDILVNRERPCFEFMDEIVWGDILRHLIEHFRLGDPNWESLAFRLWLMRVVSYTTEHASRGYDHAMGYLGGTIARYESD